MRAFVVDDEPLAVRRLSRLLEETGKAEIAGSSTDPLQALEMIPSSGLDVLFLDIQMPVLTGFQMLSKLKADPLVVFTTAYDEYALQAFSVNSVDYLLKPVEREHLDRALNKIERVRGGAEARPDLASLVQRLATALETQQPAQYPERIASKTGDKVELVDTAQVTHFFAKDKLTFAATAAKNHCVDHTISDLEQKLDPRRFVRVHRSTIVNIDYVHELHAWFAGRMLIRLKGPGQKEITVSRERVKDLKDRLKI